MRLDTLIASLLTLRELAPEQGETIVFAEDYGRDTFLSVLDVVLDSEGDIIVVVDEVEDE